MLKRHRLSRGWTQTQTAEALGIAQPTYWEYENGESFPSVPLMLDLIKVFGITSEEFTALVENGNDDEPNGDRAAA